MLRHLTAALLTLALLASLALTLRAGWAVWADPALRPFRDATLAEITASLDRDLAREATPARLAARIEARLAEAPRNWLALDALTELAAERAIALPPPLSDRLAEARAEDYSPTRLAQDCAACILDVTACTLGTALICKAPILLTPVEDLRGLGQAGYDYLQGEEIDRIDLGLSVIGLTATGLAVATGGSSLSLKAGAGMVKLARGMRLISPRLLHWAEAGLRAGIDWAALPAVRSSDDLAALVRAEVMAPLARALGDLGQTAERLGPAATLHLLPMVDDATDAARLARIAQTAGPRSVVAAELLGKSRLFRLTTRLGRVTAELLAGFATVSATLASALAHWLGTRTLRRARRLLS